jgi:hypothetical protein
MASKNVSDTLIVAGRSVYFHKGLFLSKCILEFTVLYFSEIQWFREHIEATVCLLLAVFAKVYVYSSLLP